MAARARSSCAVSDMLLYRRLLEAPDIYMSGKRGTVTIKPKALVVLPYVSLVQERAEDLQSKFGAGGQPPPPLLISSLFCRIHGATVFLHFNHSAGG